MKWRLFQLSAMLILLISLSWTPVTGIPSHSGNMSSLTGEETTVNVKVTITAIDLQTNTITLKDQRGKIYVFTVDPAKIDLKKYKVGQTFTATIATTVTTNQLNRARISKTQLLRLQ